MHELEHEQVCPYCEHVVEDHESNWSDEEEDVKCYNCNKNYSVSAKYKFLGFEVKRLCQKCGFELEEDEGVLTDWCEDCEESLEEI